MEKAEKMLNVSIKNYEKQMKGNKVISMKADLLKLKQRIKDYYG